MTVLVLVGAGALATVIVLFPCAELWDRIGMGGLDLGSASDHPWPEIPAELTEIAQMRAAIAMLRQRRSGRQAHGVPSGDLDELLHATAPEVFNELDHDPVRGRDQE